MRRLIIFRSVKSGEELVLPVTPSGYTVDAGINIESLDMQAHGVVNLPGLRRLLDQPIECMFPAQEYPFCNAGTVTDPYYYVDKFNAFSANGEVLRFIVSDTGINEPVLIEGIEYGERDGTNDVYATIRLRGYRELSAPELEHTEADSAAGNLPRSSAPEMEVTQQTYVVEPGDSLWSICRRFYGDGSLAYKLAAYNGIANANLIYDGQTITIPPRDELSAVKASAPSSSGAATSTGTQTEPNGGSGQGVTYKVNVQFMGSAAKYGRAKMTVDSKEGDEFSSTNTFRVPEGSNVVIRWNGECGAVCGMAYLTRTGTDVTGMGCAAFTAYHDEDLMLRWSMPV